MKAAKGFLCAALAVSMIIGTVPAEELLPAGGPAAPAEEEVFRVTDPEAADSGEWFAGYVDRTFYGTGAISLFGTYYRDMLTSWEQQTYDALKAQIEAVAAGERTDTRRMGPTETEKIVFSRKDLGLEGKELWELNQEGKKVLTTEARAAIGSCYNSVRIFSALLRDLPYELYWHDKTVGRIGRMKYWAIDEQDGTQSVGVLLQYDVAVAKEYANQSVSNQWTDSNGNKSTAYLAADSQKTGAAARAAQNARTVISQAADLTDRGKLKYYADYICGEVSYNHEAASAAGAYGDPWQLIYVFDGDSTTNVVCEGYSKAFKYLCDLTRFAGDVHCELAKGLLWQENLAPGPHMWNVVRFGSAWYLADITNVDTSGPALFMSGYSGRDTVTYTEENSRGEIHNVTVDRYIFRTENNGSIGYSYDEEDEPVPIWNPKNTVGAAEFSLAAPVPGEKPQTTVTGINFTGKVTWTPEISAGGTFETGQTYTATVTLIPAENYAFGEGVSVTLNGQSCTALPGTAANTVVLTREFPPAVFDEGDLNGDGLVNEADVLELLYKINFKPYTFGEDKNGDCNGDGAADILDAVLLTRKLAGRKS